MAKATIAIIVISIAFTLAPSTANAEDICTVEILDGQMVNRCVSRGQWNREMRSDLMTFYREVCLSDYSLQNEDERALCEQVLEVGKFALFYLPLDE